MTIFECIKYVIGMLAFIVSIRLWILTDKLSDKVVDLESELKFLRMDVRHMQSKGE